MPLRVEQVGLEPTTATVQARCTTQLCCYPRRLGQNVLPDGGPGRTRTAYLSTASAVLSLLSYRPRVASGT